MAARRPSTSGSAQCSALGHEYPVQKEHRSREGRSADRRQAGDIGVGRHPWVPRDGPQFAPRHSERRHPRHRHYERVPNRFRWQPVAPYRASSPAPANHTIPKPGFLASRAERRYFDTVVAYLEGRNQEVASHATEALDADGSLTSAHLLAALAIARMDGDHGAIRAHLEAVLTSDHPMPDRWQSKYLPAVAINAKITEQIVAEVPFDAVGAALVLAELYQLDGRLDEAIGLVQQLHANAPDDPLIRLSLCDLLVADSDYDGALEASAGAVNDGDIGVATLHLRGAALYGQGQPGAAAEAFTAALAKTASRDPELLNVVRYDRALAYTDAGQARRARGDLEKLAAADPTFLDVQDRLAAFA
jgi:tetratricopeptide (TPR) repeat protein